MPAAPLLPPRLGGDRDGDLSALRGRCWDTAIDTGGYFPRLVRASAELLADSVERYTFISSISVFAEFGTPGMDESAPVARIADESVEQITGETYGALKALCEDAVRSRFAAVAGETEAQKRNRGQPGETRQLAQPPHDPLGARVDRHEL